MTTYEEFVRLYLSLPRRIYEKLGGKGLEERSVTVQEFVQATRHMQRACFAKLEF